MVAEREEKRSDAEKWFDDLIGQLDVAIEQFEIAAGLPVAGDGCVVQQASRGLPGAPRRGLHLLLPRSD